MLGSKLNTSFLNGFYKNIFTMFKGVFVAQLLGFIGTVFLAKIYGKSAYGFFGFFIACSSILSVVNTLQLEYIIISSKRHNIKWFNILIKIIIATSLLFFVLLFPLTFFIEKLSLSILITSFLGAFLLSLVVINENLSVFNKDFTFISKVRVLTTFSTIFFQFLFFYVFYKSGLIIGFLTAMSLIVIIYLFKNKSFLHNEKLHFIKADKKTSTNIVKYLFPSNIANSLGINIMPVLLLFFFGAKETGEYFLSLKILTAPLLLISSSVSKVYFQKASEKINQSKKNIYKFTLKIILKIAVFMILFLLIINTIGIVLLNHFFDKNWQNLPKFIHLLSFLILARSLFNPISSITIILNKNQASLIFNIFLLISNFIAIYVGVMNKSIEYTIFTLVILAGLGYLSLLAYFLIYLKKTSNSYKLNK